MSKFLVFYIGHNSTGNQVNGHCVVHNAEYFPSHLEVEKQIIEDNNSIIQICITNVIPLTDKQFYKWISPLKSQTDKKEDNPSESA